MSIEWRARFPWPLLIFGARRILPMWSFIAAVVFAMQISVSAIVHDNQNVQTLLKFLDVLPGFIKTALGGEALQAGNVAGLISIGHQHPLVLFLYLFYAVGTPTMLLTREVQNGTMELVLSRSATKAQVYYCAAALTLAGMFSLVLIMFFGTVTATRLYDFGQPIPLDFFFRLAMNNGSIAMAAGAIALLMAGLFAGRNSAVAGSVGLLVADYFLWVVSQWWPRLGFLKPACLFYYSNGGKLAKGWPVDDLLSLGLFAVAGVVLGGVFWKHREMPL